MILVVGPGTPASALYPSGAEQHDDDDDPSNDNDSSNDNEERDDSTHDVSEGGIGDNVLHMQQEVFLEDDAPDDDDDDDSDDDDNNINNLVLEFINNEGDNEDEENHVVQNWTRSKEILPSMRHGGCINTACWLDCPWQLSTRAATGSSSTGTRAVSSHECPTQLLTAGDDRLIKVWDVKDAMGMSNPLPGGWDTFSPLAHTKNSKNAAKEPDSTTIHAAWKKYYRKRPNISRMAGSVVHLATLVSGHRGNVFQATPVWDQPGKIVTCGADGALRLSDLQSETSAVVTSTGPNGTFALFHQAMAFSHVFLNNNVGLVCSEEGLHRFDLRLAPRDQSRRSLLSSMEPDPMEDFCKACAVWSPHEQKSTRTSWSDAAVESNYVFAGGRSECVRLLDLRMEGGSSSRVIQSYKPAALSLNKTNKVSVSGLDISRDGKELLVSYENDQIYTFPILHNSSSSAGPTLEEIEVFAGSAKEHVSELASYGGHLNRFTFLKIARYAGPNDEYICTGGDSGCGWIYERKSGTVVSLLGADNCTCNGVCPHPTLPFFISYGIDSTAKLWRATPPVSVEADDSPCGRAQCALEQDYEMSPVCRSWAKVQKYVERDLSPRILPDFVASASEVASSIRFSPRDSRTISGDSSSSPKYINALRLLPSILRRNRHECYRSAQRHTEVSPGYCDLPVEQPVHEFTHRVGVCRLRFQADRLGLTWDPTRPWALLSPGEPTPLLSAPCHRADLVPDHPSDWLLWDPAMTGTPYVEANFNTRQFGDLLMERVVGERVFSVDHDNSSPCLPPWLEGYPLVDDAVVSSNQWLLVMSNDDVFVQKSRQLWYTTIALLKEGGNQAYQAGLFAAAARRYDKAIQYCAVSLMSHNYVGGGLEHLVCPNPSNSSDDCAESSSSSSKKRHRESHKSTTAGFPVWTPLLQQLVSTRLNMALWLLRPEASDPSRAMDQAAAALQLLRPFATTKNDNTASSSNSSSSVEDHNDIQSLQAKAFYRLGSAKLEVGNYSEAVECFEACLCGHVGIKVDPLVSRKLQEAKRMLKMDKKRYKRGFRRGHSEKRVPPTTDGEA
jgi:hypothetical protein